MQYGHDSVGSVTLNLPQGEVLAMCVRVVMAASIFLSYALQFYIPISIVWPSIEARIPKNAQVGAEIVFRTVLVIVTCKLVRFLTWLFSRSHALVHTVGWQTWNPATVNF